MTKAHRKGKPGQPFKATRLKRDRFKEPLQAIIKEVAQMAIKGHVNQNYTTLCNKIIVQNKYRHAQTFVFKHAFPWDANTVIYL